MIAAHAAAAVGAARVAKAIGLSTSNSYCVVRIGSHDAFLRDWSRDLANFPPAGQYHPYGPSRFHGNSTEPEVVV